MNDLWTIRKESVLVSCHVKKTKKRRSVKTKPGRKRNAFRPNALKKERKEADFVSAS